MLNINVYVTNQRESRIQFENETSEAEVKAILENYDIPVNYTIDYNSNIGRGMYYIEVDEDKIYELRKDENWTSVVEIKKGNYNIIMLSEEFVPDENVLAMLEKNNLLLVHMTPRPKCTTGGSYERYICSNEWDDEGTNVSSSFDKRIQFCPNNCRRSS